MNASVLTPVDSSSTATAIYKKSFRVTITTVPAVLNASSPKFINILLGTDGSPNASASLTGFLFTGGTVTQQFMNHGAKGHFSSAISMQCRPGSAAPQVIGLLGQNLSQFSFFVSLALNATKSDWLTLWLFDEQGNEFPTTATDRPGLIGSISWDTSGNFTTAAYSGNGLIDGLSDVGFSASISPL